MTKINQNLTIWAGDTKEIVCTVTGSDSAGYSLAGASVTWVLESYPTSGSLVRKTESSGIAISTSTVTISLSPSDTESLSPGIYYHELEARDSASRTSTLAIGTFTIKGSGA